MRVYKEYKAPKAEITLFECEDVITKSLANSISGSGDLEHNVNSYVKVGNGASWSDIYDN